MSTLAESVLAGEVRGIARLISCLENEVPGSWEDLAAIFPSTGRAHIIGVTGAPGAGKSTLVDALIGYVRAQQLTVGVIAIDPSSPFSGGALLGDRVRMQRHMADSGVYIRSMSARGALGGLSRATHNALHVLDAAGFSAILVETVGVGQSELGIASTADTVVVVTTPDMGDAVQTLKAGILEIADVFAFNKADIQGASRTLRALRATMLGYSSGGWNPPIVETIAHTGSGIEALWGKISDHLAHLQTTGSLQQRRDERLSAELLAATELGLRTDLFQLVTASTDFQQVLVTVQQRRQDPLSAAHKLLATLQPRGGFI